MDMDMGMATAWHAPVGERGVGGSRFVKKMVSISPVSGRTKQVWLFLSPFRRMKMGKKNGWDKIDSSLAPWRLQRRDVHMCFTLSSRVHCGLPLPSNQAW
jgi:hypothetical protein